MSDVLDTADSLREQAERYRWLASRTIDPEVTRRLLDLADELEVRVEAAEDVKLIAVSACPKCGHGRFDFESDADINDPRAKVRCCKCSYVCRGDEFMRSINHGEHKE